MMVVNLEKRIKETSTKKKEKEKRLNIWTVFVFDFFGVGPVYV